MGQFMRSVTFLSLLREETMLMRSYALSLFLSEYAGVCRANFEDF